MLALDTNTLIYFFQGRTSVRDRLLATQPLEIAIPSIVLYELEVGIAGANQPTKRRAQLDALLAVVTILPLDTVAARRAAIVNRTLQKAGKAIGPMDTLIAGIALSHGATLVTHNTAEFERVPGLELLDWY